MNINDLEKMLDNNPQDIIVNHQEMFTKLDTYSDFLISGNVTLEDISKLLMRVTGYWGLLDLSLNIIESYKSKKEGDYFCSRKIEIEKENGKFNASATEKEASAHVNIERRIRNIFESYRNRADKIISSCQSYLKHMNDSYKRNNNQEG